MLLARVAAALVTLASLAGSGAALAQPAARHASRDGSVVLVGASSAMDAALADAASTDAGVDAPAADAGAPDRETLEAGALAAIASAAPSLAEPVPVPLATEAPAPAPILPPPPPSATVRMHERAVLTLRVARGEQSPADRARVATRALDSVLDETGGEAAARVEAQGANAVIFVGKTPILTLGEEDAAAEGETLHVHAMAVVAHIDDAIRAERTRSHIANTVFSLSLLVFSGLMAFLLFRRVGDFATRAGEWVKANPARIPSLRLGNIEVVRPNAVRGGMTIALGLSHLLAQVAIAYGWLLIALSLFEATRGYSQRLTGFMVTPVSALLGRLGSSLPVLVVATIAAIAVGVLVRFVSLFFESVASGETTVTWLSTDLAAPTSVLVRSGIVVVALILSAPLLTGADDGAFSRVGVAALIALGLSCTPVLASAAAGIPVVFGRRLRTGEFVEVGGLAGRVLKLSLMEVTLEDALGCEVRVPHLLALVHSTRVLGRAPQVAMDVVIDPREPQARVREVLLAAAAPTCLRARVVLVSLDGDGAHYRVSGSLASAVTEGGALATAVADALVREGISLGRRGADARPA
jgi:small-conductance mechanosensitive channel